MFAGHAAFAVLGKRARPRASLAALLLAAYAPDIPNVVLGLARIPMHDGATHSIPGAGSIAALVVAAYWLGNRNAADSACVALVAASHLPADYVTGWKPLFHWWPQVGLNLYDRPVADFVLESVLLLVAWLVVRRGAPRSRLAQVWVWLPLLVGAQAVYDRWVIPIYRTLIPR